MHTLGALLLTAATACAIARPPGPYTSTGVSQNGMLRDFPVPAESPSRRYLRDHLLPRYLWPHYFGYEESPRVPYPQPQMPATDWLNKEIERINGMEEGIAMSYRSDISRPSYNTDIKRYFSTVHDTLRQPFYENIQIPSQPMKVEETFLHKEESKTTTKPPKTKPASNEEKKKLFALTPKDKGYFDPSENDNTLNNVPVEGIHEGGGQTIIEIEPRQIRQNPNLSRKKTLVAENLDKLRSGLYNKDYRLPVSLLPSNLRWLKASRPNEVDESGHEEQSTIEPEHIHMLETATPADPAGSIYGVALIAAVGAAIAMAVLGTSVGWYTLTKRAKAAADVDYPAYGVTGPTIDTSGDRKLAQSAHMYHYQHQKQQIIAMERNGMAQHNGSVSDPDSEEDNEEGHYTVYECPGFATTGEMEVKNPLFNDEPTPATPGKCEVVKQQPKE